MLHKLNSDLLSLVIKFLNLNDFSKIEKCIKLNDKITERYIKKYNDDSLFVYISSNGHLKMIKYMYKNMGSITNQQKEDAIDFACENGHLKSVKYLYTHVKAKCSEYALNWASANGNFEIVKYLCEIIRVKPDNIYYSIRLADKYGHHYVVRYLQSIKNTLK